MLNDTKKKTIAAAVCCGLFFLLILLLKTVDVKAVGPLGSSVGFSSLNSGVFKTLGQNDLFYKLSEGIGFIALLTAAFFAFLGLLQLVKGRSLASVDLDLYVLAAFYVVVLAFYLMFEKVIVNYRPVLEDGQLAASFPSSHTVLGITFLGAAALQFRKRLSDKKLRQIVVSVCQLLVLLIVISRLLSGQHWLTDIIGGVLLGSALVLAYDVVSTRLSKT